MTSVMTILAYLDANFVMCQPWGHVTSTKVTKKLFANNLRIEKSYSTVHGLIVFSSSRRIEWYTFWPWDHVLRSRDLRSPLDLDLMRSSYTQFDLYQREDLDGAIVFALARLVEKDLAKKKTPLSSSAAILILYPCDVIFYLTQTWP